MVVLLPPPGACCLLANVAVAADDNFFDSLADACPCGTNASPLLMRNERSVTLKLVTEDAGIRTGYAQRDTNAGSDLLFKYLESLIR